MALTPMVDLRRLFADLQGAGASAVIEVRERGVSLGTVRAIPRSTRSEDMTPGGLAWTRTYTIHRDDCPAGFEPFRATTVVDGGHEMAVVDMSVRLFGWTLYVKG